MLDHKLRKRGQGLGRHRRRSVGGDKAYDTREFVQLLRNMDIPNARVQFLDTGHFAVETHVVEIAAAMKEFLAANGVSQ